VPWCIWGHVAMGERSACCQPVGLDSSASAPRAGFQIKTADLCRPLASLFSLSRNLTTRSAEPDDDSPMPPLMREPPGPTDPPTHICPRCAKPITPGNAAQIAGRAVHMRCLARDMQLEAVEKPDGTREIERAAIALDQANGLVNRVRRKQTHCPACGEPFALSRSVLFQGDRLVHADCWRDDPKPVD
jgi:hypothetical protein